MERLRAIAEKASQLFAIIAGCCLMGIVFITTLNIILRRPPFYSPITGAQETSAFLGALVISLALPLNQLRKGNISVEIISSLIPQWIEAGLQRVLALISGILCGVISWQLVLYGLTLLDRNEVSMTLAIPFYPFIFVVGFCFAILAFVLLVQAIAPGERQPE